MKVFSDGSQIEFAQGRFDKWCVYLTRPNVRRHAPLDRHYFSTVERLATQHGGDFLWTVFVRLCERTSRQPDPEVFDGLTNVASRFGADSLEFDIAFTCIYMGMIAEENKAGTKLGKRIKKLAMHQILRERMNVEVAANYTKGMTWKQIDALCKERGF